MRRNGTPTPKPSARKNGEREVAGLVERIRPTLVPISQLERKLLQVGREGKVDSAERLRGSVQVRKEK